MIHNSPWSQFGLNPLLVKSLIDHGFTNPTDIQISSLYHHKYKTDLILSSKTGSGKTLCFGLPILSDLMNELGFDERFNDTQEFEAPLRVAVRGIILTPTRELAIQIKKHMDRINEYTKKYIKIGVIIGGLSKEKQHRILSKAPQIIIATPGRLWELINEDFNPYLQTLQRVNYLILDEADKMVSMGHFKELDKILDFIYKKGPSVYEALEEMKQMEDQNFMSSFYIKGPGNKKLALDDPSLNIIDGLDVIKNGQYYDDEEEGENEGNQGSTNVDGDDEDEPQGDDVDEDDEEQLDTNFVGFSDEDGGLDAEENQVGEYDNDEDGDEEDNNYEEEEDEAGRVMSLTKAHRNRLVDEEDEETRKAKKEAFKKLPKYRRTIVLSATLANSYDPRRKKMKRRERKKKGKGGGKGKAKKAVKKDIKGLDTYTIKLEMLVSKIQFNGTPKLVDLTKDAKLPETLKEYKILCPDDEKIFYVYHLLTNYPEESFIIFTNTIPMAKRVYGIINKLDVKTVCLHSEMQQRQRLKKLDQFTSGQFKVMICTDVASRGLDIPVVTFVIHYQIPNNVDTYVHRSGRTARIGREGTTFSLVGPSDKGSYLNMVKVLDREKGVDNFELSQREIDNIRALVDSAVKTEHGEFLLHKKEKHRDWFMKNAERAEVDLDEYTQAELEDVNDDIDKKRKIVTKQKVDYKRVKAKTEQKKIDPRKGGGSFLPPQKLHELAQKLASLKEQGKAGVVDNKNRQYMNDQQRRKKSKERRGKSWFK